MSRSREMWDIAHDWAYDTTGKGIGAKANMLFANGCIYSYGNHFMIARHVQNEKGESAVLFTERTYSHTTAKHVKTVEAAVAHKHLLYVADPALDKEELFTTWHDAIIAIGHRLREPKRAGRAVIAIERIGQKAKRYADFFGYVLPESLAEAGSVRNAAQFEVHLQHEYKLAKAREAKEIAKRLKLHQAKLKAWRAFELNNIHIRDGWDYLRCNVVTCQIETTQQVDIPLSTGQAFFEVIKSTIANGGCHNCGMQFMGQYPVLEINKRFIQVGCHKISFKEINRFANQQGWQ